MDVLVQVGAKIRFVDAITVIAAPRRREILRLIWDRELSAGDIAAALPVTFGAVSQHLSVLRAAGIVASWFEAVHVIGLEAGPFWQVMRDAVDFHGDFLVALQKALVFGALSAWVAAFVGYHAEPTIEGTSLATTRAVVNASLLVLMFNFVLSALLFR